LHETIDQFALSPAAVAAPERSAAAAVWDAINPVARRAIALQAILLAVTAPLYPRLGISIQWSSGATSALVLTLLIGVWLMYVLAPSRRRKIKFAEPLLAMLLLAMLTNIVGPAQYVAVALRMPTVDAWLAAGDAALGLHVPALTHWTLAHPALARVLIVAYFTLLPQFALPIVAFGIFYPDRRRLWEYIFHFHFCLAATLLGVALVPAACAFSHYGFESLIDQTRFIAHFTSLRAGTFHELRFNDIEGMISFPSFHVAGALMVTWAFRGRPFWLAVLLAVNVCLIASTVLTGAHYGVDVLATIALFAISVRLWRTWGHRGLPPA
jgi:PAP2 superfamily protein